MVSGLAYLYEICRLQHRDVKPANMLKFSENLVKICDLGGSKILRYES